MIVVIGQGVTMLVIPKIVDQLGLGMRVSGGKASAWVVG